MTREEVVELMKSSKSEEEWNKTPMKLKRLSVDIQTFGMIQSSEVVL